MMLLGAIIFISALEVAEIASFSTIRIIKGQALSNSFPYQVGISSNSNPKNSIAEPEIQDSGYAWCSGALISPVFVITAARCIERDVTNVYLNFGDSDYTRYPINKKYVMQERSSFIVHEAYDKDTLSNDIGLIRLDKPIELEDNVQTIMLPNSTETRGLNHWLYKRVIVAGWGPFWRNVSRRLRYSIVHVIAQADCADAFPNFIKNSHICTTGTDDDDFCSADSGSPLVATKSDGSKVLIGITSFVGASSCRMEMPTIYTRVSHYVDWINEKMESFENK